MPIAVKRIETYYGTVTVPSIGTETTVIDVPQQEDVYLVEGYLDLYNLGSGDSVIITEYISVDGVNYRYFGRAVAAGPQIEPVLRFHTKTLLPTMAYKVTVTQTSGTPRSFAYAFLVEVLGTV